MPTDPAAIPLAGAQLLAPGSPELAAVRPLFGVDENGVETPFDPAAFGFTHHHRTVQRLVGGLVGIAFPGFMIDIGLRQFGGTSTSEEAGLLGNLFLLVWCGFLGLFVLVGLWTLLVGLFGRSVYVFEPDRMRYRFRVLCFTRRRLDVPRVHVRRVFPTEKNNENSTYYGLSMTVDFPASTGGAGKSKTLDLLAGESRRDGPLWLCNLLRQWAGLPPEADDDEDEDDDDENENESSDDDGDENE